MKSCLNRKSFFVVLVCVAVLGLAAGVANGRTITVRADGTGDYPTIQDAIDDCNDGDEIIVYTGTYYENINFARKNIILRSTDPTDPNVVANTIIDGNQAGSVVTFSGTESPACVLSGFTITNGSGNGTNSRFGGGIYGGQVGEYEQSTLATIQNNIISGNSAIAEGEHRSAYGGGLYRCDGFIQNNIVSRNLTRGDYSSGGGLYRCNGTIQNNIITANSATGWGGIGGGLSDCDGNIYNNTISNNSGGRAGGGLLGCGGVIQNNIISGNFVTRPNSSGGGLWQCYGIIQSNVISGNSAQGDGGGIYYCYGAMIQNNTICGNSASYYSGLGRLHDSIIRNCIIWANKSTKQNPQIDDSGRISYSCIEDWTELKLGNINADPCFVEPGYWDTNGVWVDGDYHLLPDSPCINAGNSDYSSGVIKTDLEGLPRKLYGVVDMGAYEYLPGGKPLIQVSKNKFIFITSKTGPNPADQLLTICNRGHATLSWEIVEDCSWLDVVPKSGVSKGEPNQVVIIVDKNDLSVGSHACAFEISDPNAINDSQIIEIKLYVFEAIPDVPGHFSTIQDAIDAAKDGDEITVAPGIYTGNGNRDIDFLGKAITVRSFAPCNLNVIEDTVIDCNGTKDNSHRGFHFHNDEDANSILDGFTITNGYASGNYATGGGGAIYCESSPVISRCIIKNNSSEHSGGGIVCWQESKPIITKCKFMNNRAGYGGGIGSRHSNPIITKCIFNKNWASGGGGVYNSSSRPIIKDSSFFDNLAIGSGGGINNFSGEPLITDCTFKSNWCWRDGGGMYNRFGQTIISNSIFIDNFVETNHHGICAGGGMASSEGKTILKNCVFSGNWTSKYGDFGYTFGGGIFASRSEEMTIINCTIVGNSTPWKGGGIDAGTYNGGRYTIKNSIIWNNLPEQIKGNISITYSNIQDGWLGIGNLKIDPGFVESGYWDVNDVWVEGDYHLLPSSPCIDAGEPNYVAGPNETDLDGNPRVMGGQIDMGADEFTSNTEPVACIVGGDHIVEAGSECEARVTLDGSCSSDEDSTEGTNDDIVEFNWYEIIDPCDASCDIYLGSGEVIECNLPFGEHDIVLEVIDKVGAFGRNEVTITVEDDMPPVITLNGLAMVMLECGVDSYIEGGATAMDNCDGEIPVVIGGDTVDTSVCGTYVVTYDATDASGNVAEQVIRTVIVEDTTPPEFDLDVTPDVLWPPNRKMVLIRPAWTVSDNCDESPEVTLVSVTIDGDNGQTNDDIQMGDDGIWLRAERSGKGISRVYTITYQAVDGSGNATLGSATVTVPHDRR